VNVLRKVRRYVLGTHLISVVSESIEFAACFCNKIIILCIDLDGCKIRSPTRAKKIRLRVFLNVGLSRIFVL
jgi:hypothetical protein